MKKTQLIRIPFCFILFFAFFAGGLSQPFSGPELDIISFGGENILNVVDQNGVNRLADGDDCISNFEMGDKIYLNVIVHFNYLEPFPGTGDLPPIHVGIFTGQMQLLAISSPLTLFNDLNDNSVLGPNFLDYPQSDDCPENTIVKYQIYYFNVLNDSKISKDCSFSPNAEFFEGVFKLSFITPDWEDYSISFPEFFENCHFNSEPPTIAFRLPICCSTGDGSNEFLQTFYDNNSHHPRIDLSSEKKNHEINANSKIASLKNDGVIISPNPFIDCFELSFPSSLKNNNCEVTIISQTGSIISKSQYDKTDISSIQVNLGNIPKGVYFCKVQIEDSFEVFKVIKA